MMHITDGRMRRLALLTDRGEDRRPAALEASETSDDPLGQDTKLDTTYGRLGRLANTRRRGRIQTLLVYPNKDSVPI
jgi:hypothetical protein